MASLQEIETRIIGIEQMMRFVLTQFAIQSANNPFSRPVTLLDAYYRSLQGPPATPVIEADGVVKEN